MSVYGHYMDLSPAGVCLGMQVAVIEFARNVLGLKGCHVELKSSFLNLSSP